MTPSPISRRRAIRDTACGFGSLALASLLQQNALAENFDLTPKKPMVAPKAKRVIFLFMQGGVSQVDSFDRKPRLERDAGKKIKFYNARQRKIQEETVMGPMWDFKQYGECGRQVSALFPEIGKHVDDLCFLHGMHTEGVAHGPATLFLHTGALQLIRPSIGSWISYGLGTENQNLPGFITINPPMTKGGPRNWGNAFLPNVYNGTALGRVGVSAKTLQFQNIANPRSSADQRKQLDLLHQMNRAGLTGTPDDDALLAMMDSYELAFRMQGSAPQLTEIDSESEATKKLYGIGEKETDEYGRMCLMARRMAEDGVRYIQVNYSDSAATPRWDQHSNMPQHAVHAKATDKPVAGLLADLKARGLLEDTLVWWGGEFGRTPFSQNKNGRDHNPKGFTVFLAGGGVKSGFAYGETDEFGDEAVHNKVHMHDLHATILHLLGIEHEALTFRYAGRDFRLTDVYGEVVHDIIA